MQHRSRVLVPVAVVFSMLLVSGNAFADFNRGTFAVVAMGTMPSSCAIDLRVDAATDSRYNGSETLGFDGASVATLATLQSRTSSLSVGQHILFASAPFQAEYSVTPDIELTADACGRLRGGMTLTLTGSFGNEAGRLLTDPTFQAGLAISGGALVQLAVNSVLVANLSGRDFTIGRGPLAGLRGGTRTGSCSVALRGLSPDVAHGTGSARGVATVMVVAVTCAVAASRTRRRSRSSVA